MKRRLLILTSGLLVKADQGSLFDVPQPQKKKGKRDTSKLRKETRVVVRDGHAFTQTVYVDPHKQQGGLFDFHAQEPVPAQRAPQAKPEKKKVVVPSPEEPSGLFHFDFSPKEEPKAVPAPDMAVVPQEARDYVDRLLDPKKKAYAQALLNGETPDGGGLDDATRQKIQQKIKRYSSGAARPSEPSTPKLVIKKTREWLDYSKPFSEVLQDLPRYGFDLLSRSTRNERLQANTAALALAEQLHASGKKPTSEQRNVLAKFTGEGGVSGDLNAYYTPTKLAASMWALLHTHGFTGGRVLEPSIGGGVFAETAPATAQMTGVEYNPDTTSVTSLLHPDVPIHNMPFEQYNTSSDDELYDAVIGNPPYGIRGSTQDLDKPDIKTYEHYFIDSALDRVKDGGLVAVLVNFGVMQNNTPYARDWRARILARAEVVTSIRAPVSTFEDSSSLVTPDIILLRKRPSGVGRSLEYLVHRHGEQVLIDAGVHREDVMSGQYFSVAEKDAEGNVLTYRDGFHPDHALGTNTSSGRWGQAAVEGELDEQNLSKLASMPRDEQPDGPSSFQELRSILQEKGYDEKELSTAKVLSRTHSYPIPEGTISPDGERIMMNHRWHSIEEDFIKTAKPLARALESYRSDLAAGRTENAEAQRESLAQSVQDFFQEHGGNLKEIETAASTRMPYLHHLLASFQNGELSEDLRVAQHDLHADAPVGGTLEDTLHYLAARGAFSVDDVHGLFEANQHQIEHTLLASPDFCWNGSKWQASKDYFYGDVYDAQEAIDALLLHTRDSRYRAKLEQQKAIFASLLPRKTLSEMDYSPRDKFIPVHVLEHWLNDRMSSYYYEWDPATRDRIKKPLLVLQRKNGVYVAEPDEVATAGYDGRRAAMQINKRGLDDLMDYLNNKTQVERVENASKLSREDYQAARKANIDAARAYEETVSKAFKQWLLSSDYCDEVEESYNRVLNNYVAPADNFSALDLPGWTGPTLHPYQNNTVRRMARLGSGVVALDVGLGKTYTGLALASELKKTGARKPVVVSPKSLLGNWIVNSDKALKGKKVLVIGLSQKNGKWVEDSAAVKQAKLARLASENWDLVIMSRETFEDIPLRRERRLELIQTDYQAQRLLGLKGQRWKSKKGRTERQTESEREKFFGDQLSKVKSAGETDIAFEDLGIDCVIADEGHAYKNLYAAPAVFGESPKFMGAGAESNRAMDFHHKMRHVRSVTGGRGTYILTATPTKNSPLEIYNMLTLVTDHLEANGVPGVDDFINRYCDIQGVIVPTKDGSVTSAPAVVGFQNLGELRNVMSRYMVREDAQTALTKDGIGLKLPERQDIEQTFDMHPSVWGVYQQLRNAAKNVSMQDKGDDHLFAIMAKMRKLTLDPELFSPSFAGLPNPRFQKAAEIAQNALQEGGKAVVFMDLGQNTGDDDDSEGDSYDRLVEHFVQAGVPRDQIAVVTAQRVKKATDRQKIEQLFNDGHIKIVIGNTPTIGEGFNLQNGTTDMIHMDTPWDPGTYWQRLGRAVRQGNPVEKVRNHVLLGKGSFDGLTYTTMLGKKGWQQQVWDSSVDHATNATGLDLEEIALALSDDPEATRKQIKEAKEKLNQGAAQAALRNAMGTFSDYIDLREAWLKRARESSGRKNGPSENDHRVLAQREKELRDLREHLKQSEPFAPYVNLLDYAGNVVMTPQAIPLHEGMILTVQKNGQPQEVTVRSIDPKDGTMHVTGVGMGWMRITDLPSVLSWKPAELKHYYYDGAFERPSFAKAVLVTRHHGQRPRTVLLVRRGHHA